MKNLPSDFQNWLQSRSGNLTITPVDGYIQAVTFHQLVDIFSLPLYVSIDGTSKTTPKNPSTWLETTILFLRMTCSRMCLVIRQLEPWSGFR